MLIRRSILAAVLTVALTVPAWADFEEAAESFKRGDYDAAYCELRSIAKTGHPVAQFHLGFLYDTGQGVRQDYDEATKWYRRSARQGYFEAVKWGQAVRQGPWRPMPAGFITVSRQSHGTERADALSKQKITWHRAGGRVIQAENGCRWTASRAWGTTPVHRTASSVLGLNTPFVLLKKRRAYRLTARRRNSWSGSSYSRSSCGCFPGRPTRICAPPMMD